MHQKRMETYLLSSLFSIFTFFTYAQIQVEGGCTSGDCLDGFGHYEWASGEKYIGNWRDGQMFGHGVFYWASGRKYVGEWYFGKLQGEGTMFYINGRIKTGEWKDNQFVKLKRQTYSLSADNLKHGQNQVLQMLMDRPLMTSLVSKEDTIWAWAARKFAGEDIQHRIYWQSSSTKNFVVPIGVDAAHGYPTDIDDGQVWVMNSEDPERMWAGAIYELYNIQNFKAFEDVEKDVIYGRCDKEHYIMRYAELEYQAAKRTATFYKNVWLPFCGQKGLESSSRHWFANIPDTFEEWIVLYDDRQGYPWNPYSDYYEKLIKSVVKQY